MKYEAVVIGSSSGGLEALQIVLTDLPADFPLPIIIVQHVGAKGNNYLIKYLNDKSNLEVVEATPEQQITKGKIYVAPANYHLLVEADYTFSLIIGDLINYCRPAIDPLFETAAEVIQDKLIGIILTGANHDGSQGLKKIKEFGGLTVVQNPKTAYSSRMPQAANKVVEVDYLLDLVEIRDLLISLARSDNDE